MAEAAALTSIAKSALQLFTYLVKDEFLLLWHCGEDLEKLKDTIETISCFLQDAEERKSQDRSVHHCLSKLRKVMYDADDLFDALAAHLLSNKTTTSNALTKEVRRFFSRSNQLGFIFKTAHEVKSLRESLDAISKNMHQFSFIQQPQLPVDQSFTRKKTHSFVLEEDIIGRDQDRDHIINMLIPKDEKQTYLSVVAIIGFGGLGKTALAQFVYNDERVKKGFDVHLWACINYLSDLERVLKEIIASKVEKKLLDLSVQMLQEKLRKIIGGKKFFIVLDDVWDENSENWRDLETILRCGKSGSKVLITTRSSKVAKCLHASEPYCYLEGLLEESAWSLFVKRAFQGVEMSKYSELEQIGKKILSKCGNVPLAIVSVGSLLNQKKRDERTWREFYDNKLKEVLSSGDDSIVKQVLKVSYEDLHPNLKLCFVYCSLLPKEDKFDKDDLVRLWLAQGILKPSVNKEQSLEEEGEAYFFQLVDRSFFQDVKYEYALFAKNRYVGNAGYKCTAKMHDLLHDMATDVAKAENLFLDEVPEDKRDGLRHISVAFEVDDSFDFCNLVSDPKTVRTLVLFWCREQLSKKSFTSLLDSFTMIRTLDLAYLGVDEVPESIGRLIHLRYLELSGNIKLKHLPNSICKLHHLMFVLLKDCRLLEKLPRRIEKLVSLRQLFIDGCNSLDSLPPGLKALTSLVNLDRLIVHRCEGGLGYLKCLDNLTGVLRIELPEEGWVDATNDAKNANMARKHKLNEMDIKWKRSSASSTDGQKMGKDEAKAVLEALRPHEKLEYLRIKKYEGEMLPSWFWTLKCVKELWLDGCDNLEYLEDGINGHLCFPSLQLLGMVSMTNLRGWKRQEMAQGENRPHLSTVSRVEIRGCPKLKGQMPLFEGVEYLSLSGVGAEVVTELLLPNCSNKLMELRLSEIEGLVSLAEGWIRHLTALQELTIVKCKELSWVSCRGLAHLTALKKLVVESGEIGDEDDDEEDDKMISQARMPWKALQGLGWLTVTVGDRQLLEGVQYLTLLTNLKIERWEDDLKGFELPFKALQNLRSLAIGFGDKAAFQLPKSGIQNLHSLRRLGISDCKEFYMSWKTLLVNMKLLELSLIGVGRVIDVEEGKTTVVDPQQIQLRSLHISGWEGGKLVDDDIPWCSLSSSLTELILRGRGEREQLPDGIQHLTSLRFLEIWGCSAELKRRCQNGREDWPLIRHIPHTRISSLTPPASSSPYPADYYIESNNESMEEDEEKQEEGRRKGRCGGLSLF